MSMNIKVCHIYPFYFEPIFELELEENCFLGGGERYVFELCRAMAKKVNTKLIIFGDKRRQLNYGQLQIEVYPALNYLETLNGRSNPVSFRFLRELDDCRVIHLHQLRADSNLIAALYGKMKGKKVFATDHGWNGACFGRLKVLEHLVDGFLSQTDFDMRNYNKYQKLTRIIYGGVNVEKFSPSIEKKKSNRILYIGRIMPHKGINYLIEAVDDSMDLHIIGKVVSEGYFTYLRQLAKGKNVDFMTSADDERIVKEYQEALVCVLPSVYTDMYGKYYPKPELFGLVLIEAMACGTPVIATDVGALPEVVKNGEVGFIIPPNDFEALRKKITFLLKNPDLAGEMGKKGRALVLEGFTWDKVAERCLRAYADALE